MGRLTVPEKKLKELEAARAAEVDRVAKKFDSSARERYLRLLRAGGRRYASARAVGVTGDYVRKVRSKDPLFDEACRGAELEGLEPVETVLMEAAVDRAEPWAVKMVLERRDVDRWGDRKVVAVEVSGTVEVEVGERLARVRELEARLQERAVLRSGMDVAVSGLVGDVVDAEIVEDGGS